MREEGEEKELAEVDDESEEATAADVAVVCDGAGACECIEDVVRIVAGVVAAGAARGRVDGWIELAVGEVLAAVVAPVFGGGLRATGTGSGRAPTPLWLFGVKFDGNGFGGMEEGGEERRTRDDRTCDRTERKANQEHLRKGTSGKGENSINHPIELSNRID